MTITYLKTGKPDAERALDDANTKASVEKILVDIEERGDAAVRDLSSKFDKYTPKNFRLTDQEIESLLAALSERELADIKFAQEQVLSLIHI